MFFFSIFFQLFSLLIYMVSLKCLDEKITFSFFFKKNRTLAWPFSTGPWSKMTFQAKYHVSRELKGFCLNEHNFHFCFFYGGGKKFRNYTIFLVRVETDSLYALLWGFFDQYVALFERNCQYIVVLKFFTCLYSFLTCWIL